MLGNINRYVLFVLFIVLLASVAGYFLKGEDYRGIKQINRTLARHVKTGKFPESAGALSARQVAIKAGDQDPKATLSQSELARLRRVFSRSKSALSVSSLPKSKTIILANRTITVPENAEAPSALSQNQIPTQRETLPYILHFGTPVTAEIRRQLEDRGAILRGYLPNYAFLAELTLEALQLLAGDDSIDYITEYTVEDKVQPFLTSLTKTQNADETLQVSIQTVDSRDVAYVERFLEQRGASVESINRLPQWGLVYATLALSDVAPLAELGEVQWIEEHVEPTMLNDMAAEGEHLNAVPLWNDWNLTGKGQIVGHADTGLDTGDEMTIHEDFKGQIKAIYDRANGGTDAADYDGHGTHTAGSICGSGASSGGQYRGIAYEAQLVSQCVVDRDTGYFTGVSDLEDLYQQSYDAGVSIHSDSWGGAVYGEYDSLSRSTDLFAWENKDFLPVFSAGNSGVDYSYDGVVDLDSISSPATAKNVLSVGATENDRTVASEGYRAIKYGTAWPYSYRTNPIKSDYISWSASPSPYLQGMAAYSSRGPTDDQRIKPEVCAPGTDVISTRSSVSGASSEWGVLPANTRYCYSGGTSMSCPLTAGSAALIRQYMVERAGISRPSSALLKAAMVGGARSLAPGQYGTGATQEIPFTSPNNVEGWGQPDLKQAVHPEGLMIKLIDNLSPATGETNLVEITVEKSGEPLDIVLSWIDYPATAGAAVTLVNDLNLNVVTPGTNTLYPNSGTGNDAVNTVESVAISSATSGVYRVMVIGNNVPQSGGTAALYIRGAINEQPIIVHEPETYINSEQTSYPINFKVQSLHVLTNSELTVFYNTGTDNTVTGDWQRATTEWTGNAGYQAVIPQLPENTVVHYYINFSNELYALDFPPGATESNTYFTMNLRTPVSLIVEGSPDEYSTVAPAYGTNTLLRGVEYTASAATETISTTEQRVACDWNGTGDIPASGSANPVSIELTRESTLTWNWQTQYLLTRNVYLKNFNATISGSTGWYWKDQVVPDQEAESLLSVGYYDETYLYAFYGWSVDGARWPDDSSPSTTPLSGLVMSNAFSLQANYMEFATDEDGDFLYDWWEMSYYGGTNSTDSVEEDSDGDLWTNLGESLDNTDPFDAASVPTSPVITVIPLDPFQSEHPPWRVTAEVTDNFIITDVILQWREKGDTAWQQAGMDYQDNNTFAGVLNPASHGAKRVDYRVVAYDLVAYYEPSLASVSAEYSVAGDYDAPWISLTSSFPDMAELTEQPTNYTLNVSNLAGPDLVWTGILLAASSSFNAEDPGWAHSGSNDNWNISTHRTWNEEPVWYCGNDDTHLYPNECFASLDTPAFTVEKDAVLVFRHWMDFEEYGSSMENYYWDGARVMISTNSGASFAKVEPVGGYNGLIVSNDDSPFSADESCFGDTGSGWQSAMVDLSEFAGSSAIIRFQFGSDHYVVDEGWYVASVTVLTPEASRPAWGTPTGSWSGILPDMWSNQFGLAIDPLFMATNSEHVLCVRIDSNDPENSPIVDLTVRRGFSVTGEAVGAGIISVNDPFIFRSEASSVDIQADYGSYLTNVTLNGVFQSGDYGYNDTFRNYTTQPVTGNLHFTADFALRSWNLIVNSAYGTAAPAVGYHSITHGTAVDASVTTPVTEADPMIRYSADSMTLEGVDPVSAATGGVSFVLTNDAVLTWQWTTNYQLKALSTGNGVVVPVSEWYSAGSIGCTTGYPSRYYSFGSWAGDLEGAEIDESIISFTMDSPRSVSASFDVTLTPSHNVPETWLASYGFKGDMEAAAESDQDGDTMASWKEWRCDTDPTDINSLLKISALTTTSDSGSELSWIGGVMRTQIVQSAVVPSGPWTALYTNLPPAAVSNNIQMLKNSSNRFFRVVVP